MAIRIIVRTVDVSAAANVGGPVETTWRTFDVDLPEIEAHIRRAAGTLVSTEVVGIELVDVTTAARLTP